MANHSLWQDEYWLLLLQLYLKKPVGVKTVYSRSMINIALELHIEPEFLYEQMFHLRNLDTPYMKRLWEKFAKHPQKLNHSVEQLRMMRGFCNATNFYSGVEINESWEKYFHNIPGYDISPVMLIIILDLYFRLTPITMVADTPEIQEMADIIGISGMEIAKVMYIFQLCDPYLNKVDLDMSPLLPYCSDIWQKFGNGNPQELASKAAQLKEYFK